MIETREITGDITIGILDLRTLPVSSSPQSRRDKEKAGTRLVLENLLKTTDFELSYTLHNKPYLKSRTEHISISHSHDKVAVIINRKSNTGIDIELLRDKVLKIKHKFLNAGELVFAGENVEKLITIWAAKETMYKYYGLRQLDFIDHLSVEDFEGADIFGKIETVDFKKKMRLVREKTGDYVLVYIADEMDEA